MARPNRSPPRKKIAKASGGFYPLPSVGPLKASRISFPAMRSLRDLKTLLLLPFMAFSPLLHASASHDHGSPTEEEETPTFPNARRIAVFHWKDYIPKESNTLKLEGANGELLSITGRTQTGGLTRLFQIGAPKISTRYYALKGEIRYQSVSGAGYLELLNHFPGVEKEYFSRTNADSGPMRRIEGHSDWRTIWIPFNAEAVGEQPDRLTLNLMLASIAQITLGPMELYEFTDAASMMTAVTAGDDTPPSPSLSLSRPERRIGMALTLLGITTVVGGIHLAHLRREKRKGQTS